MLNLKIFIVYYNVKENKCCLQIKFIIILKEGLNMRNNDFFEIVNSNKKLVKPENYKNYYNNIFKELYEAAKNEINLYFEADNAKAAYLSIVKVLELRQKSDDLAYYLWMNSLSDNMFVPYDYTIGDLLYMKTGYDGFYDLNLPAGVNRKEFYEIVESDKNFLKPNYFLEIYDILSTCVLNAKTKTNFCEEGVN